jgi:methionine-rich copper-binding protein CopC
VAVLPLLAAFAAPRAEFHLRLLKAEPGVNDTVAVAPTAIRLWFSERPAVAVSAVALVGPTGPVKVAKPTLADGEHAPLVAAVEGPVAPGTYRVNWRAMSDDGHPMRGWFRFVYRPAAK